jgi:hypothetical protein
MMPSRAPRVFQEYAKAGGPLPRLGVPAESFWAGYDGQPGVRRGVGGSVQRAAWNAGAKRALAEPGLTRPAAAGSHASVK